MALEGGCDSSRESSQASPRTADAARKLLGSLNGSELRNNVGDALLLRHLQAGKHRKRENLICRCFRLGEISALPPERAVGVQQVKRNRIVNARADPCTAQALLQALAVVRANYVQMIDALGPGRLGRQGDAVSHRPQQVAIDPCALAALLG